MDTLLKFMKKDCPSSTVTFTNHSQVEAAKRALIEADDWTIVDLNDDYFRQPLYLVYR